MRGRRRSSSVTWNLQPFHGFCVGGPNHRHHRARNPCACHAKSIISDPLLIPHACQRFCNPQKCYFAVIISRGSYRTSYVSAQLFRGRRSTFEASTWKSLKRIGILRSSNMSFLKEVSQKCFVVDLQRFIFEGSLAQKLRFWTSKLHFWRKSRRNASFLIFKASFLKEVSHKSFVFELQSFVFEGSLAQKRRFWAAQRRFWRKFRTKASFLSCTASFLEEVSQKIASFLSCKASILKEVSQKFFLFDLQSFVFEGSLAEQLQSVSQSVSQINQSVSQSVSQSVGQSPNQSASQIASQSVNQLVSQWVSRSESQSVS